MILEVDKMELFKGYIKTKNKKAVEKFKNRTDLHTLDEVKDLDEYAGVLGEETILIDVDDMSQAEKLMDVIEKKNINCKVLMTTRGRHFLFKNTDVKQCYTGVNLACGITADIKVGCKNSYEVLKLNGKERESDWDAEQYDELPKFLLPIKHGGKNFTDLRDGRNTAFYSYILTLQCAGFNMEEGRDCIKLINRYIIPEPLPDDEIDTILRDESFQKPVFFNGREFLFDRFAKFLVNEHHIKRINNQLHLYSEGIYISGMNEIEAKIIEYIPDLKQAQRREVLSYIDLLVRDESEVAKPTLIAFKNGVYDIESDVLMEFDPTHVITNKINWDYNANAYHELLDRTLNKLSCDDVEIRANLEEMVGYCLFRRNELGKCFILTGEGSNGKSTYLNIIKCMLGKRNYSVLDIKKLGDRFSTVMLFGKLANIGDDISSEFLSDVAEFRKIVTGEEIDAEQKGQPKFNFTPYVKCIFSSNSIPRMGKGKDFNAIKRRLVIIPFNAHFSKEDSDYVPYIADHLQTQDGMEYLIQLGIQGLKRILANNSFTESAKVNEEISSYEELSNPIIGFIKDREDYIYNQSTVDVYAEYVKYCNDNNLTKLGHKVFVNQLKKELNLSVKQKRINGERVQILEREE